MITLSTLKKAALTGTAALLLPATVFAATPQQMLNTALRTNLTAPYRLNGEIKIDMTEKPISRKELTKTANVVMRFNERVQSETKGSEAVEGLIELTKFRASADIAGEPDITLPAPITFEWKMVNRVVYLQIHELPSVITEQLRMMEIDLSKVTNRWIKIDLGELTDGLLSELNVASIPVNPTSETSLMDLLNLSKIQPLTVTRIESTKKLADGRTIMRLRVHVNPTFVNEMQRLERNKIAKNDPERTDKLTKLNTRYTELRTFIAHLQLAMEVDSGAQRLTRIEMGGTQTEPSKDCTWNTRLNRDVCKIVAYKILRYSVGLNLEKDGGAPIVTPTDAVDFKTLIEEISPTPEPEPEPIMTEDWNWIEEESTPTEIGM
jgi:hypothetical protein